MHRGTDPYHPPLTLNWDDTPALPRSPSPRALPAIPSPPFPASSNHSSTDSNGTAPLLDLNHHRTGRATSPSPSPSEDLRALLEGSGPGADGQGEDEDGEFLPAFRPAADDHPTIGSGGRGGVEPHSAAAGGGAGVERLPSPVAQNPFEDVTEREEEEQEEEGRAGSSLAYLNGDSSTDLPTTASNDNSTAAVELPHSESTITLDPPFQISPSPPLIPPHRSTPPPLASTSSTLNATPGGGSASYHPTPHQELQHELMETRQALEDLRAEVAQRDDALDEDFRVAIELLEVARRRARVPHLHMGEREVRREDHYSPATTITSVAPTIHHTIPTQARSPPTRTDTAETVELTAVQETILSEIRQLRQQLPTSPSPVPRAPVTLSTSPPPHHHHQQPANLIEEKEGMGGGSSGGDLDGEDLPYAAPTAFDLAEMARLNTLIREAYDQIEQLTSSESQAKKDLAAAVEREKLARARYQAAESNQQNVMVDDSSAIRAQLVALNSRIDDLVFLMLDSIMGLDVGVSSQVKREISNIPQFRTYATLVKMKNFSQTAGEEERTLNEFLTDGFKTIICRTLYDLVFKPFKVGLDPEADRYVSALYQNMDSVPQEKVSRWRFLTYSALPSHDEQSFTTDLSANLLIHFESVLRACGIPQFSLQKYKSDMARLIQEAMRWRVKTRTGCTGDFEPFLDLPDFVVLSSGEQGGSGGGGHSRNGSVRRVEGYDVDGTGQLIRRASANSTRSRESNRSNNGSGALGFRGFGLLKVDRMTEPGMGAAGKVVPSKVVLMSGQPILDGEDANGLI